MKINLVCEGGGVRGIAHIGALCALEDYGFTFNSFEFQPCGRTPQAECLMRLLQH